ncbi:MAG: threonine-phosphate decarboxylase CobD [Thermodesulfobacteriota bacterium]
MNKIHGGNIFEIARQYGKNPDKLIDFSASINPLGFSKRAEKKMKTNLSSIIHYPDNESFLIKKTLAEYHGLPEENFLVGAGSTEFIYGLPWVLKIRRALIVVPTFSEYENALESFGGGKIEIHYLETMEEDGFEIDPGKLISALARGYDVLYLCNPNNPTGVLTEREELLKILKVTEAEKIWFVLDEAFIDFVEKESFKKEVLSSQRLIIMRSLTKFFALPGLRVGYLISSPQLIQEFKEKREPWRVNALAQIAAVESLQDKNYIQKTKELIEEEKERLIQELRAIPGFIPYPGKANFLLVQINPHLYLTARELQEMLIREGILIRDCRSFHHLGPFFFRIAIRSFRENNRLLKALQKIQQKIVRQENP